MCFVNCVVALLFLISCIATKDPSGMPYVITFFCVGNYWRAYGCCLQIANFKI